jgi:hypothetical protein
MLKNKTFAVLTLALAVLGTASVHADDRLLETTPYGWYYQRQVRTDGTITSIERRGQDTVILLDNGQYTRLVAAADADVRLGTRRDAHLSDLRRGDAVRVIGRPGANGSMIARRIDVLNADRDRNPRTRRR